MAPWSHTRLEATRCPLRFKLKYIDHATEAEIGESEGKLVHAALERYAGHCRDRNVSADIDAANAIAATLPPEVLANHDFAAYCALLDFDWANIIGFEKQYTLPIPDTDESFTGIIDLCELVEGTLKIYDYKSYWGPKEQPALCPAQLQRYAWLVASQVECDAIEVSIVYLPSGQVHTWQIEPVFELDAIQDALTGEILAARGMSHFSPVAGSWCRWCGYKCTLEELDVVLKDEAGKAELAERIVVAEAKLNAAKKLLQLHCKDTGPVVTGDLQAGYFEKTSDAYDGNALAKAILEAGVMVEGVLTVNKAKLNQKGVQKKLLAAGIDSEKLATPETRTAWSIRKSTGEVDDE